MALIDPNRDRRAICGNLGVALTKAKSLNSFMSYFYVYDLPGEMAQWEKHPYIPAGDADEACFRSLVHWNQLKAWFQSLIPLYPEYRDATKFIRDAIERMRNKRNREVCVGTRPGPVTCHWEKYLTKEDQENWAIALRLATNIKDELGSAVALWSSQYGNGLPSPALEKTPIPPATLPFRSFPEPPVSYEEVARICRAQSWKVAPKPEVAVTPTVVTPVPVTVIPVIKPAVVVEEPTPVSVVEEPIPVVEKVPVAPVTPVVAKPLVPTLPEVFAPLVQGISALTKTKGFQWLLWGGFGVFAVSMITLAVKRKK